MTPERIIRISRILVAAWLALAAPAAAATLATGPIGSPSDSSFASCRIVNLSKKARTVTVRVFNQSGVEIAVTPDFDLAPGATVLQSGALTAGESAYCLFEVPGSARQYRGELCVDQSTLSRHYCVSAR